MLFNVISDAFMEMEATSKRQELTLILSKLFNQTPKNDLRKVVYLTQGKIYPDYRGIELGVADKSVLKALSIWSGVDIRQLETMYHDLGDLGNVAEQRLSKNSQTTLFSQPLTLNHVYETLESIATIKGSRSLEMKLRFIVNLLNNSSPCESKYLIRTVTGRLRLGIADYTILDALAIAFTKDKKNRIYLERAYNVCSDLGEVAQTIATRGLQAIKEIRIQVGRPVRPMLAERLDSAKEIVVKMGGVCSAEHKLDGERLQVHKNDNKIDIFSRRMEEITAQYPDVADSCRAGIRSKNAIVEGEVVAINPETGRYLAFQELMHRRRKYGIKDAVKNYPVSFYCFDILHSLGEDLTTRPYAKRREILEANLIVDGKLHLVPRELTDNPRKIDRFMRSALAKGCEGLVIKDIESPYRAGAREFSWIKLKREYRTGFKETTDLVIIGAFFGKGRRVGKYGAFLLAAFDAVNDKFKTVCKIGTGFTDEDLDTLFAKLNVQAVPNPDRRVESNMSADVWFPPRIVIEIAASEVTLSPIHTVARNSIRQNAGLALRFPKYTGRLRVDKSPEDSTTEDEIIEMYRSNLKGRSPLKQP